MSDGGYYPQLTGRVAVVTGCASGIGQGIAVAFAGAGADIVGLDINEVGARATAEVVSALGRSALALPCDVADPSAVEAAFLAAERRFGRVDILVNNAAAGTHTRPQDLAVQEWQRVLDVCLTGYFLCAQAAGRRMIAQGDGGAIVNLSSIAASSALGRGNFAYSVSKGGVNQLTRELAVEWATHRIRVNAIQPCQVRTPGLQALIDDPQFDASALLATFLRGIPLGRLAEVRDITNAALFLASDAAAMITGVCLPVDGGNLALNAGGAVSW